MKYFLLLMVIFNLSCSLFDKDHKLSAEIRKLKADYYSELKQRCSKDEIYDGLRNTFQYQACILDEKILTMQLELNSKYYLWSTEEYARRKSDLAASLQKETLVFLSFYSPDSKIDDLSIKASIWKIFLESSGVRSEGHVMKLPSKYEDIKSVYPMHSPWSTAYEVKFPKGIQTFAQEEFQFTITSRVGFSRIDLALKK